MHLGDILDLDRLGAYVCQRLLLVLQLLLLLPLLLGFPGLFVDRVQLLVELADALILLLDARLDLLDALLRLSHCGGLLCDLLLPLLLGERVGGHRNRWSRRVRLRRVGLEPRQLSTALGQLTSCPAQLVDCVGAIVLKFGALLAQLSLLIGGSLLGLALLLVGQSLLLVGQLVSSLILRLLLLELADRKLEVADIGWTRFVRLLTADDDVALLARDSDGAYWGTAQSAGNCLADLALSEAERGGLLLVHAHPKHLALLFQIALDVGQAGNGLQLLLDSLRPGLQVFGVLARDSDRQVVAGPLVVGHCHGDVAGGFAELCHLRLELWA